MLIQITQVCIEDGLKNSKALCPVAIGLFKSTGKAWHVWNEGTCLADDYEGDWFMFPDWVIEKIDAFDDSLGMEPFEFEIDYTV